MSQISHGVIRLALLDDQTLFREGLQALMADEGDLRVVAQASSLQELEDLDPDPQVVITGLALADGRRNTVIERLRSSFRETAIVALTALDDLPTVQQVLAAGADGYILKSASRSDLFAGIRTVARGGLYLQPSIGIAFASRPPDELTQQSIGGLTPKETDVLRLLALGHTNAEAAQLLGTSLRTVETHRAHIHQKLDRHSRSQLVRFALDAGLLRLDERGAPSSVSLANRTEDPVRV